MWQYKAKRVVLWAYRVKSVLANAWAEGTLLSSREYVNWNRSDMTDKKRRGTGNGEF